MKVRDDQMCSYCNDVVNCIQHFFFNCPTIKKFWNYIQQCILITFDPINCCWCFVLFGIKQHDYGKVKTKRINHVILIAKMCISMYKKLTPSFHCPCYLKISSGSEMFNNYCEKLKNENCAHCNQGEEAYYGMYMWGEKNHTKTCECVSERNTVTMDEGLWINAPQWCAWPKKKKKKKKKKRLQHSSSVHVLLVKFFPELVHP